MEQGQSDPSISHPHSLSLASSPTRNPRRKKKRGSRDGSLLRRRRRDCGVQNVRISRPSAYTGNPRRKRYEEVATGAAGEDVDGNHHILVDFLVWTLIMSTRRNVRYSPLTGEESDDDNGIGGQEDLRFSYNPRAFDRVPWKSIALALFLLALGSILLFLAFFIFAGHMEGDKSQAFGLLALGILSFLPGFYETRVAYYAWRGAPGYRFSSIPSY